MVSPTSPAKAPSFAIVVNEKGGSERRELFESSEITVGRVQGNDLMLPKGNVSKRHARMLYRDGRYIVTDLNSTNGTYVNRRRITQATIVRDGDRIYIGDFVLRIESPDQSAGQEARVSASSVVQPSTRQPVPTVGDSNPEGVLRSAFDEEEEHTRSSPVRTKSNPVASTEALAPRAIPEPGVPRANPDPAALRTNPDDDPALNLFEREQVAALVSRVASSLPSSELGRKASVELAEQIERALGDAWRALSSERPGGVPLPSGRIIAAARAELAELGPLGGLLDDPAVSEVALVGCDRMTLVRRGKSRLAEGAFSTEAALRWAIQRLFQRAGAKLEDGASGECRLADGTAIRAALSSVGPSILLVRKPRHLSGSLDDLVRRGTVSRALATFLQQCLLARVNILIVGPRDGGVEVLLGALAASVPEKELVYAGDFDAATGRESQRIQSYGPIQEVARAVGLAARAPLLRLAVELGAPAITEAVVGALADGADGVIATRAASSLERGLLRLRAELGGYSDVAARTLIAGSFEVIAEVARLRDDRHRVLRVAELVDGGGGSFELADVFTFVIDRTAAGGMIEGSFLPSGAMPAIADMLRSRGAAIDSSLFSRPPSR